MSETIPHWLDKQADLSPHTIAIEMIDRGSITFFELKESARKFARKLATKGIKIGDHVAIYANNSLEMVIMIHSLSYLGAVAVLLNTRLSSKEINYQLVDANVTFLLISNELLDQAESVMEINNISVYSFEQIQQELESTIQLKQEIQLDDVFTIIYTSGTTGFPKGVQHTYGNHWWSAISSALNLGIEKKDKWLASLPLFHVGGLSVLIKSVIYGMPVYLLKKFDLAIVHQAIMEKGVTIVSVVSIMLKRLIEKLEKQTYPSQFRCMLLGGGPAPKSLLEKAKEHHIPVFQTYGMTETSSQIVTLSPKDALEKLGSAGKPLVPAQLKIMSNDKALSPHEIGEIVVKGPMVTKGYFRNEEANKQTFHDGWLSTGDLGYLDEEGFLYVMDRRKDLIISGGENIYPAEVENVIGGIQGVSEVGVVGKKSDEWGQVPVAFIVKNSDSLTEDMIVNECKVQLAKFKIPKELHFVDHLPRNASNKLVRYKLVEWLNESD